LSIEEIVCEEDLTEKVIQDEKPTEEIVPESTTQSILQQTVPSTASTEKEIPVIFDETVEIMTEEKETPSEKSYSH
jgi:hypothetical protein